MSTEVVQRYTAIRTIKQGQIVVKLEEDEILGARVSQVLGTPNDSLRIAVAMAAAECIAYAEDMSSLTLTPEFYERLPFPIKQQHVQVRSRLLM